MGNQRWTAGPDEAGQRLDKYLAAAERLGSRSRAAAALERGKVFLNKPAGVLAVPLERQGGARSVFDDLHQYLKRRRRPRPLVVHRIDRDTSGLVLFAKTAAAQQ